MVIYQEVYPDHETVRCLTAFSRLWEEENVTYGYGADREEDYEGRRIFAAKEDDAIIGFLTARLYHSETMQSVMAEGTPCFEIEELYVIRERRRQGIGRKLFAYASEILSKEAQCLTLTAANRDFQPLLSFYRDAGMQVHHIRMFRKSGQEEKPQFFIKSFSQLSADEIFEILRTRIEIFVVEQTCPYQEADETDRHSLHIFSRDSHGRVTSYLRLFRKDEDTVQMGRVLTLKHGEGLGGKLLKEGIRAAEELMHAKKIFIEAQCYAAGFYEKEGFHIISDEFLEDGIPHVAMERISA